jgi:hypothetical protein
MSSACTYKHNILDLKKEFMSDVLRLESPRLLKTHVLGRQALGYHKGGNRGVVCTLLTASGFYFWTRSWHLDIWKVGLRHKGGLYLCSSSRALEFALWGAKTRGRPSWSPLSLPSSQVRPLRALRHAHFVCVWACFSSPAIAAASRLLHNTGVVSSPHTCRLSRPVF